MVGEQDRRAPWPRRTLAGQILAVQVLLFALVLVGVGSVSVTQTRAATLAEQERRAREVAEYVGALPLVRGQLSGLTQGSVPVGALLSTAEQLRASFDVTTVLLASPDGRVVVSPADPRLTGQQVPVSPAGDPRDTSWVGQTEVAGASSVAASAPVLSPTLPQRGGTGEDEAPTTPPPATLVGSVVVAVRTPTIAEVVRAGAADLLTYLGLATLVGIAGSVWLSRRVKSQTLGLEPDEIAFLATHREAVLRGIREGVVALDPDGVVTVVNDGARELLGLPVDAVGRRVHELGLPPDVVNVLLKEPAPVDQPVVSGDRLLVVNRTALHHRGTAGSEVVGTVATMRDRTELVTLRGELGASRAATSALRAQTHEFANRLHTISGLVQLERYEDAVGFIQRVSRARAELGGDVTSRVHDPAVAALLLASTSLADERDVELVLAGGAVLPPVDERLSDDLVTVVGNLVDNAVDAAAGDGAQVAGGLVEVDVRSDGAGGAVVQVTDSGPGLDPADLTDVVRRGRTTKHGDAPGGRGVGLALVQLTCQRRGGGLELGRAPGGGARFTARLPAAPDAVADREASGSREPCPGAYAGTRPGTSTDALPPVGAVEHD